MKKTLIHFAVFFFFFCGVNPAKSNAGSLSERESRAYEARVRNTISSINDLLNSYYSVIDAQPNSDFNTQCLPYIMSYFANSAVTMPKFEPITMGDEDCKSYYAALNAFMAQTGSAPKDSVLKIRFYQINGNVDIYATVQRKLKLMNQSNNAPDSFITSNCDIIFRLVDGKLAIVNATNELDKRSLTQVTFSHEENKSKTHIEFKIFPQAANLTVNDKPYYFVNSQADAASPGKYKIHLEYLSYVPFDTVIELRENETVKETITLLPKYGKFTIAGKGRSKHATVSVDGNVIGRLPVKEYILPIGHHTIAISKSGFYTKIDSLSITENELVRCQKIKLDKFKKRANPYAFLNTAAIYWNRVGLTLDQIDDIILRVQTFRGNVDEYLNSPFFSKAANIVNKYNVSKEALQDYIDRGKNVKGKVDDVIKKAKGKSGGKLLNSLFGDD